MKLLRFALSQWLITHAHAFTDNDDGFSNLKWPQISDVHKCYGMVGACNSARTRKLECAMEMSWNSKISRNTGTVIVSCLLGHVTASREMS